MKHALGTQSIGFTSAAVSDGRGMRLIDHILVELEQESATTRRMLERVPDDKLGWSPHEKSMSLGELASHIVTIAGEIAAVAFAPGFDIESIRPPQSLATKAET